MAGKTAVSIKVLDAKPKDLNSVLESHLVERKSHSQKLSSDLCMFTMVYEHAHTHMNTHTHTQTTCNVKRRKKTLQMLGTQEGVLPGVSIFSSVPVSKNATYIQGTGDLT